MKKLILFLALLPVLLFCSCEKLFDTEPKAEVSIQTWLQSNYSEYGYYSDGEFHYIISPFELQEIDSINLRDTSYVSSTGVPIIIENNSVYIEEGGEKYLVEHRIDYGTSEIHFTIKSTNYVKITCYDILFQIRFEDNSTEDIIFNGTGVQKRTSVEDIFYFETQGKRVIDVKVIDYSLYKNC
jgi:hypothetical protein